MIFQAINLIRTELTNSGITADLGSIGDITAGSTHANLTGDIIITLVNVEENRISRDPRNYVKTGNEITLKNPPVHLYLTLLFTAARSNDAYEPALRNLQTLIQFFQAKYVFDHSNTQNLDENIEKLIMEMMSMNLEQLNHLWSILGGRYQPSVIYKMRMITIDSVSDMQGSVIKEIQTKFYME